MKSAILMGLVMILSSYTCNSKKSEKKEFEARVQVFANDFFKADLETKEKPIAKLVSPKLSLGADGNYEGDVEFLIGKNSINGKMKFFGEEKCEFKIGAINGSIKAKGGVELKGSIEFDFTTKEFYQTIKGIRKKIFKNIAPSKSQGKQEEGSIKSNITLQNIIDSIVKRDRELDWGVPSREVKYYWSHCGSLNMSEIKQNNAQNTIEFDRRILALKKKFILQLTSAAERNLINAKYEMLSYQIISSCHREAENKYNNIFDYELNSTQQKKMREVIEVLFSEDYFMQIEYCGGRSKNQKMDCIKDKEDKKKGKARYLNPNEDF